jgi:hypothetical protein
MSRFLLRLFSLCMLSVLISSCYGKCEGCWQGVFNVNGVYICYGEDDHSTTCGGVRVFACNSQSVSKSAKIESYLNFSDAPKTVSQVTVPSDAQISDKTAVYLGMSEGWSSNQQCHNRNYSVVSAN